MCKGIKEALLRVNEIVVQAETGCSQEVHGHDKACEKFHDTASRWLFNYTTPLKRGGGPRKNPAGAGLVSLLK
jgi:hypothetical protein